MVFGVGDIMLSIIKESAKEVSRGSCHEAEVAGEGTDTCKSSFGSSDFGKLDMKIDGSIDANQFDNLDNSPEVFQVEKSFHPSNFEEGKKEKNVGGNAVSEETEPQNATVSMEWGTQNTSSEVYVANSHNASDISFGNLYDDRTKDFLNDCKKYDIELPTSVTRAGHGIDRSVDGGLQSIDKSLIETSLKSALEKGKVSRELYERLHKKLVSC